MPLYSWHEIIQLMFCLWSFRGGDLQNKPVCKLYIGSCFFSDKLDFQSNENDNLNLNIIFKGRWKSINFTNLNGNCIFSLIFQLNLKESLCI